MYWNMRLNYAKPTKMPEMILAVTLINQIIYLEDETLSIIWKVDMTHCLSYLYRILSQ